MPSKGKEPPDVRCDCGRAAELMLNSSAIYHGRDFGPVWICHPCDAWVGVHKGSPRFIPLGRLANAELRKAKIRAHAAFDPLWRAKIETLEHTGGSPNARKTARVDGYKWLAEQMQISRRDCHIGMFTVEQCQQVVNICAPIIEKIRAKRSAHGA